MPSENSIKPYRITPVFDERTIPSPFLNRHDTRAGVWGVLRVLDGKVKLTLLDTGAEYLLDKDHPGVVTPQQPHVLTLMGAFRMQVEFYDQAPPVTMG